MKIQTLESLTADGGLITDGDWIESKDQDQAGTVRLIQLADIGDGQFINKSRKFINERTCQRLNCTLLRKGDVLIARMPDPMGRACVFPDIGQPAITAVDICIVRPNPEIVDAEWLAQCLNTPRVRRLIQEHGQGATRARVPTGKLKKLELHIPSLSEQQNLVARLKARLAGVAKTQQSILSTWPDISLLRRRLLDEIFSRHVNDPIKTLGNHALTKSGSTPPRGDRRYWEAGDIPWVKTGEVAFAPIANTDETISNLALAECSLTLLPPKTVLIAMYGQGKTRGQSALLEIAATTNQACFAILPNDTWEPEFLYFWLMSQYQSLRNLSDDRGGNQANLNGALLNALKVPVPDRIGQQITIQRVKNALVELDTLSAATSLMLADLDELPRRILAQAFESAA